MITIAEIADKMPSIMQMWLMMSVFAVALAGCSSTHRVMAFLVLPVAGFLQLEGPEAQAQSLEQRQGLEAQQVHGRGEVPDFAPVEETHLGLQPVQLVPQAQLLNQVGHIGVADEQVVVSLFQLAAADGEGGGLPPQKGSRLEDLGLVALKGQLVGGGQPGGAPSYDANFHEGSSWDRVLE